jgi:hypothetical protein
MPLLFDVAMLIDPNGELSPDMFGDADDTALSTRLAGYLTAAKNDCAAAGLILEPTLTADIPLNRQLMLQEYILYKAYQRLATKNNLTPGTQSQPEYSRTMQAEQIKQLNKDRQQHLENFQDLLGKALLMQNGTVATGNRVVSTNDLERG